MRQNRAVISVMGHSRMKIILFGGTLCALALLSLASVSPSFAQVSRSDDAHGAYSLNQDRSKILCTIGHFYVSTTEGKFSSFDGTLKFDPAAPEHGTVTIHVSPG